MSEVQGASLSEAVSLLLHVLYGSLLSLTFNVHPISCAQSTLADGLLYP